jgi:hypothetical protein
MSPCFDFYVQFLVLKARSNVNFHPFLSFISQHLNHVIHFCKYDWVDLLETYFKSLDILFVVVAY